MAGQIVRQPYAFLGKHGHSRLIAVLKGEGEIAPKC